MFGRLIWVALWKFTIFMSLLSRRLKADIFVVCHYSLKIFIIVMMIILENFNL